MSLIPFFVSPFLKVKDETTRSVELIVTFKIRRDNLKPHFSALFFFFFYGGGEAGL